MQFPQCKSCCGANMSNEADYQTGSNIHRMDVCWSAKYRSMAKKKVGYNCARPRPLKAHLQRTLFVP